MALFYYYFYVFIIIIFDFSEMLVSSKYCYWNAGCSYKLFGSKTPYGSIRGDIRDSVYNIKGCRPISIWSIYRHGQRFPGIDYGKKIRNAITLKDEIISSYEKRNSDLCAQDVENLRNWVRNDTMFDKAHDLTDEGYAELVGIAKRLRETYPDFLSNLDEGSYVIRPAIGRWIEESAKGFVEGLSGDVSKLKIEPPTEYRDIMAPYTNCKRYQDGVKSHPSTYLETTALHNSEEFVTMVDRIQKRLGIEYLLTEENVTSLYDMCRYSWSGLEMKPTPWCALFSTDDLRILEYDVDIRHYYRNSYGTPINLKFGGVPLKDLYEQFELAKKDEAKKIIAYFTHSTMIDMIYSAVGFFKDDFILKGSSRVDERKWRTSLTSGFAANIIAVMNKCENETQNNNENVIMFYLNEKRLNVCPNGWCNWKEFEDKFKQFLNTTIDFCDDKF